MPVCVCYVGCWHVPVLGGLAFALVFPPKKLIKKEYCVCGPPPPTSDFLQGWTLPRREGKPIGAHLRDSKTRPLWVIWAPIVLWGMHLHAEGPFRQPHSTLRVSLTSAGGNARSRSRWLGSRQTRRCGLFGWQPTGDSPPGPMPLPDDGVRHGFKALRFPILSTPSGRREKARKGALGCTGGPGVEFGSLAFFLHPLKQKKNKKMTLSLLLSVLQ